MTETNRVGRPTANGQMFVAGAKAKPDSHISGKPLVEVYEWKIVDQPGEFRMIDKARLNVDHDYQRRAIAAARILRMSREFSWSAFGALTVGERPDSSLWLIDGQRRKLAADKRADIALVPCMVFRVERKQQEAAAFLGANADRLGVSALSRYIAGVQAGNPVMAGVDEMIRASGYTVADFPKDYTVQCVALLVQLYGRNKSLARDAWALAVRACAGRPVHNKLLKAIYCLEKWVSKHGHTLTDGVHAERLAAAGQDRLIAAIDDATRFYQSATEKVLAFGLCNFLNKGRRSNALPQITITSTRGDNDE